MLSNTAVQVSDLGKCFHFYDKPNHRLLQLLCGDKKQFYKEFWALRNVSFSVERGEAVGIVGLNGSGKSTLLQMICGTLHPTTGDIKVSGRIAALLELGSGFNTEFTGRENVFLYAALFGLKPREIQSRLSQIEAFAEIGDFIDQPVKTYSSGMYVRLAFSVIANIDADILIVDEALSVGDAFFQQKCMRFLRSFRERGTLIFVSHDSGAIINLCDRALWLNNGKLIKDALPNDVVDAYMANLYELNQGRSNHYFRRKVDCNAEQPAALKHEFNPQAPSFGTGDAIIQNVFMENEQGARIDRVFGGENISVSIHALMKDRAERPIFGMQVKDRLGQVIFGNNSYLKYENCPVECAQNELVTAKFSFVMPTLLPGLYSIQVAVANGTQTNHVQLHYIHEAMIFEIGTSKERRHYDGMIYIPMKNIEIIRKDIQHGAS